MKLLVNGKEAFHYLSDAIDQAQSSIQIRMFVWRDDFIGNLVLERLMKAANRGVKITIYKDQYAEILEKGEENKQSLFHKESSLLCKFGTFLLDKGYPMNKPKGYRQLPNPLAIQFVAHPNVSFYKGMYKDHTKYYLIDDLTLIFGGMNIEDKEFSQDYLGRTYHDLMLVIEEQHMIQGFLQQMNNPINSQWREDSFVFNQKRSFQIAQTINSLIDLAHHEIVITMAYFGAKSCFHALRRAIKRGVIVHIFTSEFANLQKDVNRRFLRRLYQLHPEHVHIHLGSQMVHAKYIICDDWITFGSANLNNKGYYALREMNFITKNPTLRSNLLKSREQEMQTSFQVTHQNQLHYSKWRAFFEWFAS